MNRLEAYEAEKKKIEEELGYYVCLSDAIDMIKTAQKIVSVINDRKYYVSYKEVCLILRIADRLLKEVTGGVE